MTGEMLGRVLILKSMRYGAPEVEHLPYRIDLLRNSGFSLVWTDENLGRPWNRFARLEAATTPWVQTLLTRKLRRTSCAVLAMFESEAHGLAFSRRLTRRRRPPLIVIGCWLTDLVRNGGLRASLYRWLYRSVDTVIVFSSNQQETLINELGMPPDRVRIVQFGVDLDELADVATSERGPVVAVGRDLGRDWTTFIEAIRGTGWDVHLATRSSQVEGIELPAEVTLHTILSRADYLKLIASASVVVVPTHVREYPTGQTVMLEAMALGKACVVTSTPAMADYADDHNAILVPVGDAGALRQSIGRLLEDGDLRNSIGQTAHRRTESGRGAAGMWEQIGVIVRERSLRPAQSTTGRLAALARTHR